MPCGWTAKAVLLGFLALAFVVQTGLVYTDAPGRVVLEGQALAGRKIWQRENCQVCHQMYGFGGFLGPDLTNVSARIQRSQLDELLTAGRKQMPAFGLEPGEIESVWAFLQAMNETGIGQARQPDSSPAAADTVLASLGPDASLTTSQTLEQSIAKSGNAEVKAGLRLFQTRTCAACHTLFARSAIGAPDLSLVTGRLSTDEILTVLEKGKMPLMPPASLSPEERLEVVAFLEFLGEYRVTQPKRTTRKAGSFWTTLPWWEFE